MNKKKKKSVPELPEEEKERLRQCIRLHGEQLAEELNLRLLLESDITSPILYVDSVVVTEICFPVRAEKLRDMLLRKLQYIGKYIRSFLIRFFRKETGSIYKSR